MHVCVQSDLLFKIGLAIRRAALRIASTGARFPYSQSSAFAHAQIYCACAYCTYLRKKDCATIGNRTVVLLVFAVKVVITYKWSNPFSKSELRLTVANSTRLHLIDIPRGKIRDVQFCCGQAGDRCCCGIAGCVYR